MNLFLQFTYDSYLVYIPDGYIRDTQTLQQDFLDWVEDQPRCWLAGGLGYTEEDFLTYLNTVILGESREKAYLLPTPAKGHRPRFILRF